VLPLVLCLSIVALVFALRRFRPQPAQPPPPEAATQAGKINEPTPPETSERRQESSSPASGIPDWQALAVDLDVAGTTQSKDTNAVLVEFNEGLFARGTILKPDARERLAQLGSKLKSRADNISIEIIGLTDDLPVPFNSRYKDNIVLGMERARVVYDYLRNSAGLGSQTLTIGSLGEQTVDGSKITPARRAKRRTVIFRINTRRELPKT
jgi:flagellar motor protein MotB